ncbi:MAG: hypothetical protein GX446_10390 [Chthonomonadales bacterium]|nr:hypothetical protein [Chthonomonadales bacterium]
MIQTADLDALEASGANVLLCNIAADPTWGPFAQRLSVLETRTIVQRLRGKDVRTITYIEGVGDCMIYAVAFARRPDGSLEKHPEDPLTAKPVRTHWCWVADGLPLGDEVSWAGIHASVGGEKHVQPAYTLAARGIPVPRYPDGRPATGRLHGPREPLNAEVWDACASKDINGDVRPIFGPVAGVTPGEAPAEPYRRGLYAAVGGRDEIDGASVEPGVTVWCGVISVHKDLSAPFWREYARASVREIARAGVDGVWCDNWSPWDNFGYPPIKHAFGDWSLHRLRKYIANRAPLRAVRDAAVCDVASLEVRSALKSRSAHYGVKDPSNLADPGWSDRRWPADPLWRLVKAGRQVCAREDLRLLYQALHKGAREGGCRDFAVCCNDIPMYGLGWAREPWTDMVHTEVTPGWHMGSGTRGIMLPPMGKMAVVYRAALAHQSGRHCAAWYYLDGPHAEHRGKEALAKALLSEALANGAFLLCDPGQSRVVGSVETHAWLNGFVRAHQASYEDRIPVADTALVFSPDCQLYELAPGGFPDIDVQPHVFGHWGWGTALMDAHIPYVVLPDWRLTGRDLSAFRTLILPDVVCLSDGALRSVIAWVRGGGHLVTTGPCGIRHGTDGAYMDRPQHLHAALGVPLTSEWRSHPVGKGRLSSVADPVGMVYYLKPERRAAALPELRGVVGGTHIIPEATAPTTVEVAVWRQPGRTGWMVDLANIGVDLGKDVVAEAPAIAVRIRAPWSGKTVAALSSPDQGTRLTCTEDGAGLILQVAGLRHYASVRLAPAG